MTRIVDEGHVLHINQRSNGLWSWSVWVKGGPVLATGTRWSERGAIKAARKTSRRIRNMGW